MSVLQYLAATTQKLRIVVDANATTNESRVIVNYSVQTATSPFTPAPAVATTNGTTAVDILGAPGASEQRSITNFIVWNRDTVDHTYTIYLDISGTEYNIYTAQSVKAGKSTILAVSGGGGSSGGGVNGPASSTNRAVATWSGTAGDTLLNNSNNTVDSSGITNDPAAEITGTAGGGYIGVPAQSSDPSAPSATGYRLSSTSAGYLAWRMKNGTDTYRRAFIGALTANRDYTTPDKTGTLAMLDDVPISLPGGRLTLTTGVPVTTADVTAAGTLYYTPYVSGSIKLYTSSAWKQYIFTELSLSFTLTSGKNYDVFIYDNSGTLTLVLSAAWTNDTTRADALATQDGVTVLSSDHSRLWLGTIRASGSNVTEDSKAKRFVWNAYNRVSRYLYAAISAATYTYATNTVRQCNAQASYQLEIVTGLAAETISVINNLQVAGGNGVDLISSIGEDSTTAAFATCSTGRSYDAAAAAQQSSNFSVLSTIPPLGYHYYVGQEKVGAGTATVYGSTYTPTPSIIKGDWYA